MQNTSAANKQQREDFIQAYNILKKGGIFDSSHLKNYSLYPYLEHQRIKANLKTSSNHALINFIETNKRSWLAADLRTYLLIRLAKQKQWKTLLKYYVKGQGGNKAKCLGLEATLRTTPSQAIFDDAMKLWLSGNRRPKVCNSLFSVLKHKGLITNKLIWQRISLAMEKGKTRLARDLSKHSNDKSLVSLWTNLRKKPAKHLKNKRLKKKDQRSRQLIAYAIKRLARKNTDKARKTWKQFQKTHPFSVSEKASVESYIGVREAQDHNPYVLQKLARIPAKYRSDDATTWMARMALRQGDWKKLKLAINSMQEEQQQKDRWRYWLAYVDKRLGSNDWKQQLSSVSKNASFYGFLAADELKQPYTRLLQKERNWKKLTPKIKNIASIQRATELFSLGMEDLAKKEWFWALKHLNKNDKLTTAAYALEINQPFLAIVTVSKTKDWNQVGLRFPLEYRALVKKSARKHGIIPAWIYAIMRKESAFDPNIVSSANAKGLMQVLPSTAKNIARKLGIKSYRHSDLFIPQKNVNLGAAYLSQMLKRFKGNYVKATASYNAGPHRIPRWAPDYKISAPRWIESIPFNETRNYVRAVMSYTTIYDHKLHYKSGTNLRLSQRLQTITPK